MRAEIQVPTEGGTGGEGLEKAKERERERERVGQTQRDRGWERERGETSVADA